MDALGSVKAAAGTREQTIVHESDADLTYVRRVQAGDVGAFDFLIRKYRERVYSVIYNITSNREDTADLTQETFIKAFSSIQRFRGKSAFFTWLYRIAVNHTLSQIRRNRLRRFFSLDTVNEEFDAHEIINALSEKSSTDRTTLMRELQEKLNEALQKLSPSHRTVVVLFEVEGLSHQEISEILECSVGTVRSRLHYAKQQLQAHLQDYLN